MSGFDPFFEEAKKKYLRMNPLPKERSSTQAAVGFIGMPGSGKTTVTRELTKALPLFRISGDDLRDIFGSMGIVRREERESLVDRAREHLLEWALTQRFSVIWDGDLIRRVFEMKRCVETQGIPLLVIKLECSEATLLSRLEGKGEEYVRALPHWRREHKENELDPKEFFYIINAEEDLVPQIETLVGKIKSLESNPTD